VTYTSAPTAPAIILANQSRGKIISVPFTNLILSTLSSTIILPHMICHCHRYKLSIIAGDETGDTNFIMFGRWVQRLTKKAADTLIAKNPQGFIPNEITRLLEKVFKFNVSFTENTTSSDKVCFQVNAVVAEVNDTNVLTTGSQSSSLLISQSAGSSMQRTPQKSAAFTLTSQSSGTTPTKTINIPESQLTPQSHGYNNQVKKFPSFYR
jgi:replication factor A1